MALPVAPKRNSVKPGESQKAVAFLVVAVLGTLAFCVVSGVLFYIYNEKVDSQMSPEQRISKALQSNDRLIIENQLKKTPLGTQGRDMAVKHYFEILKNDALSSADPSQINVMMSQFKTDSSEYRQISAHLQDIQKQIQQESSSGNLKSVAGMRFSNEKVVGDEAIVDYRFIIGVPSASLVAAEILELVYDISCQMPEIKVVKVKMVMQPTGVVDKYGNEVKEDTEICVIPYRTDPEASKYKNVFYWRQRGSFDESDLLASNICMNNPELRSYIECGK